MSAFLGSFHPVLVHLPIGILVFAAVADLWTLRTRNSVHRASLGFLYGAGALTAVLSCISGYVLSKSDSYAGTIVDRHQWLGIASAVLASSCWFLHRPGRRFQEIPFVAYAMPVIMLTVLTAAGHAGGTLTHGEGYLLSSAPEFVQRWTGYVKPTEKKFAFTDIREAAAYPDVAAVIFAQRCAGCHGPGKQKGGLRLDGPDWIRKGGKNGDALIPGNPAQSLIVHRMLLPVDDEDHMPPKEKPQPSKAEIAFLQWWIAQGGNFERKVGASPLPDSLHLLFSIMATPTGGSIGEDSKATADLAPEPPEAADPARIDALEKQGILVMPIASGSANLDVSLVNCTMQPDSALALLEPIAPQVIHLHTAGLPVTNKGLASIGTLTRLRRLNLAHASISDDGLKALSGLRDLQYLNLTHTPVHAAGLQPLTSLQALKSIYLYGTGVKTGDWAALQRAFPNTALDSGGYRLPKRASDTEKLSDRIR